MTFKEYLKTRRITNTPTGDFTLDARSDRNLPDAQSWDDLKRYLSRVTQYEIREKVLRAANEVWRSYQKRLRETPR